MKVRMDITESQSASGDLEMIVHGPSGRNKPETRLWLRMLSTTKLITTEIRRRLRAEFGATLPQFDLMAQLYRETDGLRLGELSKRTMVTNGNVTGLVERLETDGLVRRVTPDKDRRGTRAGCASFLRISTRRRWMRSGRISGGSRARPATICPVQTSNNPDPQPSASLRTRAAAG